MSKQARKTEYPILFSTVMVKAILEGQKTVTRRVVKHRFGMSDVELAHKDGAGTGWIFWHKGTKPNRTTPEQTAKLYPEDEGVKKYCVGDVLWVRETFQYIYEDGYKEPVYRASKEGRSWETGSEGWTWRPSIFMPKMASRIRLKIVDVRCEPLNIITEAEALKEGIGVLKHLSYLSDPTMVFKVLWEGINGTGSWDANPWVWVIEFEVLETEAAQCAPIK